MVIKEKGDVYIALSNADFVQQVIESKERHEPSMFKLSGISESFQLKVATLAHRNAFRLAFKTMFAKKLRLFFMTLLFIFSLTFVGVALSLSFYNPNHAAALSFENQNMSVISFYKTVYSCEHNCEYVDTTATDADVAYLREHFPDQQFYKTLLYSNSVSGLLNVSQVTHRGPSIKSASLTVRIFRLFSAFTRKMTVKS